jgi:gamma-glutamyltranspeptidase/glutathione hydrolase
MLKHLVLPLVLTLASCSTLPQPAPSARGMVSAADPRAAEAGREILNAGGSAADAAIATAIALTVVEPQSSGLGGGGFIVHHDERRDRVTSFDGREEAPSAAGPDWFLGPDGKPMPIGEAIPGGKSVGVPGNIRMMALAHSSHGKLKWARLFDPAIRLARDGFAITPRFRRALENSERTAALTAWGRSTFYDASGAPRAVGTVVRNPELAAFLEQLAARGPGWFYTGANAEALVRTVNQAPRNPSRMAAGDLAAYDAKQREPLCGTYRAYRICGMGPPSSGGTTVFAILKQLERFDMSAFRPDDPRAWHLIGDSMRLAYADREAYLGDPDHVSVPVAGLMDAGYLKSRSQLIDAQRALASVSAGTPPGAKRAAAGVDSEVAGTSHLVAVDAAGNVASFTSTIESVFGSGLTFNGMYLNNELTDFSMVAVRDGMPVANRVEGGKRPRSSMSPTIVYGPDGEVRIAIGAAGGTTIIAQVAKALVGVLDWNLTAQEAIALPTMIGIGDQLRVERGTSLEAMGPALTAMGHRIVPVEPGFKANAVERVAGRWRGAADPRSEGVALAQ